MSNNVQKLVQNFRELTGCTEPVAMSYLQHVNGNLEAAIEHYFNLGGNPDPAANGSTAGASTPGNAPVGAAPDLLHSDHVV